MKFVIFLALFAAVYAQVEVQVLQDLREGPVGAVYYNLLELDNGIKREETGSEGSAGQSNAVGSFSFISPEGEAVDISYTADENGFVAQGDAIPPQPAHVAQLLEIAAQQRAEGIEFDERGTRI